MHWLRWFIYLVTAELSARQERCTDPAESGSITEGSRRSPLLYGPSSHL